MRNTRIACVDEALAAIPDGSTVAIQGSGGGVNEPSFILRSLGRRFEKTGSPRGLTLVHATGLGDRDTLGTDCLVTEGLVKRDIAGHLAMAPKMAKLLYEDKIEGYNLPQGVISHLYQAIASRKPGVLTKVGLGTFVDPRIEGGKVNASAKDSLVKLIELEGQEWLFFPSFPINVAIVRGTTADTRGNITMEHEAAILEGISIAQAAKSSGGIVIVQVKYLTESGRLDPRDVKIPGIYVDYVVVDPEQKQHTLAEYDPSLSGEHPIPLDRLSPLPQDERKIIGMRAAEELRPGMVVNLGVGIPSAVAAVAAETGVLDTITFTVEQGLVGGRPAGGIIFGVSHNPEAVIGEDDQFNFYDGGGLDVAFLGMAQTGESGDVNVSKVGPMLSGCGGFINISQNAAKVVFCGTFTTKGLDIRVGGGKLQIIAEGAVTKFVKNVAQITFSGAMAKASGREILYITERAVFRLAAGGLELIEIAPGIDLEHDVLAHMEFLPKIVTPLGMMNPSYFSEDVK